jgi:triacylglycerol lipase
MTNAWIQRLLTTVIVVFGLICSYHWRHLHVAVPLLVVMLLLICIGVFESMQFIFLYACNRHDPAPKANWRQYAAAYWSELTISLKVFGIWQPFQHRAVRDGFEKDTQQRCGIILVHGFFCNRAFWNGWMRQLQREGRVFVAIDLEPAFGSIDGYAPAIEQAARQMEQLTGKPSVLIGHSMGGLAIRAWLSQRTAEQNGVNTARLVKHVITLGTPHHGTWFGRLSHALNGRQMAISSDWLSNLSRKVNAQAHLKYTCIYSNCDNIVFPVSSATLPGADNRMVTGLGHVAMAYDKQVQQVCWKLMH